MKKIYIASILIIIFLLGVFAFYIISYNKTLTNEQLQQQQDISEAKQKQAQIDEEFSKQQTSKEIERIEEEKATSLRDQDGDGLTYAQEVNLGTDDNNVDSDGDGIWDNEDLHPAGGGKTNTIQVQWTHNGLPYSTQFGIHEDKYQYYKNQPRTGYYYQDGRFATPKDQIIQTIAKDITDVSISTGDTYKTGIAIDFVESMTYQYDIDYIKQPDYPKYAIETIIDERGDCEDTSFLMASILEALNIDTVLLLYSDHMAIGVWCDGCSGTYYNYNGRKYYFLETTGYADNWELGKIWGKYADESAKIIDVS